MERRLRPSLLDLRGIGYHFQKENAMRFPVKQVDLNLKVVPGEGLEPTRLLHRRILSR
jgi:hypothetical protein